MGLCHLIILGSISESLYVSVLFYRHFSSHVLHEDVLERFFLGERRLYTKRLLVKKGFGNMPFWLRRALSDRQELVLEESVIDLEKKEILTSTRNFGGLAGFAVVVEECRYTSDPNNSSSTAIARHIELKSSLGARVLSPLWSFLSRRYLNSAERSLLGYRSICQQFAGEIGSQSFYPMTHSKFASRLKEFAFKRRPRVIRARAGNEDLD
ncbi:hypothetical protein Aperf_G00000044168 [Anoplocephala perfoliata]